MAALKVLAYFSKTLVFNYTLLKSTKRFAKIKAFNIKTIFDHCEHCEIQAFWNKTLH